MSAQSGEWWAGIKDHLGPVIAEVPWFDRVRELAELAFDTGAAVSGHYATDDAREPQSVEFANGRTVSISRNHHGAPFLVVGKK